MSPFFTPASGKTHMAATMKMAVTMTNPDSPGRIGDPLQNASTPATISVTAETTALTSFGMAIAWFRPSVGTHRHRRRLVRTERGATHVLLHALGVDAVAA